MTPKPSYLGAFWRHPTNRASLLAAGCAAIFASIPLGWAGFALVSVVALGTEVLAALAVPSLPSFRAQVDRAHHLEQRTARQTRLLAELNSIGDRKALATYRDMASRVQALFQAVGDTRNALTRADVEKLEDLLVDYLGLCVVSHALKQRKDSEVDGSLGRRIESIEAMLQDPRITDGEKRQLRTARAEYDEAEGRARRLAARRSAIEATLISMPDKMEEVYQLVISAHYASGMDGKLEESLARLRIAEEVAAEFDDSESPEAGARAASSTSSAAPSISRAAQARAVEDFIRK